MIRISQLSAGGKRLSLPAFFPSISSIKTNFSPFEYLRLLVQIGHPQFLISAYDLLRAETEGSDTQALIGDAGANNVIILTDSGNYESYWNHDAKWSVESLHKILPTIQCDFRFTYDNQNPPKTAEEIATDVVAHIERDSAVSAPGIVAPIIHGTPLNLDRACQLVVERTSVEFIAVAERELGDGILERTRSVRQIRAALDDSGRDVALHILGTGNPLSIATFSVAGADSFDGLEWCQTAVDHSSGRLSHFQHGDLFLHQTPVGLAPKGQFAAAVLAHNLLYFEKLMRGLRAGGTARAFDVIENCAGPEATEQIVSALEETG